MELAQFVRRTARFACFAAMAAITTLASAADKLHDGAPIWVHSTRGDYWLGVKKWKVTGGGPHTLQQMNIVSVTKNPNGEIHSGDIVKIQAVKPVNRNGSRWVAPYDDRVRISVDDDDARALLVIVKLSGSEGPELHYGDTFKIRGYSGDPWFYVPGRGDLRTRTEAEATQLTFATYRDMEIAKNKEAADSGKPDSGNCSWECRTSEGGQMQCQWVGYGC